MMTERISLLIVEDDGPIRDLLLTLFCDKYSCTVAEDGHTAIELFARRVYQMMITGAAIPDLSGIQLCRLIRNASPQTAIIVISGYSAYALRENALRAGADDFIQKPFTIDEIVRRVEAVLNKRIAIEVGKERM